MSLSFKKIHKNFTFRSGSKSKWRGLNPLGQKPGIRNLDMFGGLFHDNLPSIGKYFGNMYRDFTGANQNFQLQKENLEYQKNLQKEIFEREDNSVARRKADLLAAGLSPVLAAGDGAGAGAVVGTQAPQISELPLDQIPSLILSAMTTKANIAKSAAEIALLGQETKGKALDNVGKSVDAYNATQSGIGNKSGILGQGYKDIHGAIDTWLNRAKQFKPQIKKSGNILKNSSLDILGSALRMGLPWLNINRPNTKPMPNKKNGGR